MKIGVFGDSYCDKGLIKSDKPKIWFNFLQQDHDLQCFGENGSSIWFSANLILQKAQEFDLVIWCLTTPGRFTLPHVINDRHVHVVTGQDKCRIDDVEIQKKHQVCKDYLKYIFDWDSENFVCLAVVEKICRIHNNIMIVPCFPPPLNSEFNLYNLCEKEAQHYFPGKTIPEIYSQYQDLRPGHITETNQEILGRLIGQHLGPGIFQTSYDNFVSPSKPFTEVFVPL